jgi:hypothetical protein
VCVLLTLDLDALLRRTEVLRGLGVFSVAASRVQTPESPETRFPGGPRFDADPGCLPGIVGDLDIA